MLVSVPRTKKGHTKENCIMNINEISSPIQSHLSSSERVEVEDACITRRDAVFAMFLLHNKY